MKKIFLLLLSMSFLFVIGCGSGGGGSTAGTPTNSPDGVKVATFTINLQEGAPVVSAAAVSSGLRHASAVTPGTINAGAADHVRVVIRKIVTETHNVDICPEYDDQDNCVGTPVPTPVTTTSEIYRRIVDADIVSNTAVITAPVSADNSDTYTFDVLTYHAGTPNEMLKFGHLPGVVVSDNGSADIIINDICADPAVDLTSTSKVGSVFAQIPDKLFPEQTYKVAFDAKTPVKKYFELGISLLDSGTAAANTYALASNPVKTSGKANLIAPYTEDLGDTLLKFQVKYFISDDMLDKTKGELYTDWVRIYPGDTGTTGGSLESIFVPLANVSVPAANN